MTTELKRTFRKLFSAKFPGMAKTEEMYKVRR
jgi:hypothetical protein